MGVSLWEFPFLDRFPFYRRFCPFRYLKRGSDGGYTLARGKNAKQPLPRAFGFGLRQCRGREVTSVPPLCSIFPLHLQSFKRAHRRCGNVIRPQKVYSALTGMIYRVPYTMTSKTIENFLSLLPSITMTPASYTQHNVMSSHLHIRVPLPVKSTNCFSWRRWKPSFFCEHF